MATVEREPGASDVQGGVPQGHTPVNHKAPVFMVGDRVLWLDPDDELGDWEGTVTASRLNEPTVVVKLDVGGTFHAPRADLRPLDTERKNHDRR